MPLTYIDNNDDDNDDDDVNMTSSASETAAMVRQPSNTAGCVMKGDDDDSYLIESEAVRQSATGATRQGRHDRAVQLQVKITAIIII